MPERARAPIETAERNRRSDRPLRTVEHLDSLAFDEDGGRRHHAIRHRHRNGRTLPSVSVCLELMHGGRTWTVLKPARERTGRVDADFHNRGSVDYEVPVDGLAPWVDDRSNEGHELHLDGGGPRAGRSRRWSRRAPGTDGATDGGKDSEPDANRVQQWALQAL